MSRARTPFAPSVSPTPSFNTSEQRHEFRQAWLDLLSPYTWEWLGHFTFAPEPPKPGDFFRDIPRGCAFVHPETADKRFRLFVARANRELHGPRWAKKGLGISWARGTERQQRGTLHYHALFAGVGALRRLTYMDFWNQIAGYARIGEPRNSDRVLRYITKYVVKGGEIDLGGPWFDLSPKGARLPFPPRNFGQVGHS